MYGTGSTFEISHGLPHHFFNLDRPLSSSSTVHTCSKMSVKIVRYPEEGIKQGIYTPFVLLYSDELDQPTLECQQKWRAFEKTFFEQACVNRSEEDVFQYRAKIRIVPGTDQWTWAIGYRHTIVLITEEELQWLVTNGTNVVSDCPNRTL